MIRGRVRNGVVVLEKKEALCEGTEVAIEPLTQASAAADRRQFDHLVAEWKSGRGHSSKVEDLVMHPSYQRIIGLGESAIPLLVEEMRDRPDHWDWALRAITGTDPVPREAWGKLGQVGAAWVAWAVERGYVA